MVLRPLLRPGAALVRRDAHQLQVGTAPGIVVPDQPGLWEFLLGLDGSRDLPALCDDVAHAVPDLAEDVPALLSRLIATGVVVDASARRPRRRPERVSVHGSRGARRITSAVEHALDDLGRGALEPDRPDLIVVVSIDEPPRSPLEALHARGIAHLVVVGADTSVRIGPLVLPGRTPCIGCLDRHRTDWDPGWPALVAQLGLRSVRAPDTSPLVLRRGATEVAAEVDALLNGRPLRSVGRRLEVSVDGVADLPTPLGFHHACGCALLPRAAGLLRVP